MKKLCNLKSKSGISLIAVLMFMLAATTASVVVFRWLSSENFASGARLKQSEAYQASEAGLDAVYSWLTFKAADVGGVLGHYVDKEKGNRQPIDLSRLVLPDLPEEFGDRQQRFNVYLVGADVSARPFKLKFLSEGRGRDNSKVSQMAVFSVDGLYTMKRPTSKFTEDDEYDLADIEGNLGTVNELEVARAVITQTPAIKNAGGQALNRIKIGTQDKPGYLLLDGNFYVNNGLNVYGDVYVTGDLDLCPATSDFITGNLYVNGITHPKGTLRIDGDAYFKGGMDPNKSINDAGTGTGGCTGQANGGVLSVGGNSTIQNNFVYWNAGAGGGLGFHVEKNMVMDNGVIDLTRQASNVSDSLSAYGNVYIENALTGTVPNTAATKSIPFFGNSSTSTVCIPGGGPAYRTNPSAVINPSTCNNPPLKDWGADPMDGTASGKNYIDRLGNEDQASCENTPIQFNKAIYDGVKSDNPPNWVHKENKPGSCTISNNKMKLAEVNANAWVDLGTELQDCWNKASVNRNELYEGQWLVVYIKDKTNFTANGKLTTGKYIIVFEASATTYNLSLPPTEGEAQVMLYFPIGYPGKVELGGTSIGKGHRYFIFSDGDIRQFDTGKNRLHGNVFMNNCAVMNSGFQGNPSFKSEGNTELVKELTDIGALCRTKEGKVGCQDDQSGNGGSSSSAEETVEDNYFISVGPRLRVALESKYIGKEKIKDPKNLPEDIEKSILVMPRVIYLKEDAFKNSKSIKDYYNFIYRNYQGSPPYTPNKESIDPICTSDGSAINYNSPAPKVYTCTFDNPEISPFTLYISKGTSERKISLDKPAYPVANNDCTPVYVVVNGSGEECKAEIALENQTSDWNTNCKSIVDIPAGGNQTVLACEKICLNEAKAASMRMSLNILDGNCALTVPSSDVEVYRDSPRARVTREDVNDGSETPPISTWPDCPASSWFISPAGACTPMEQLGNQWECEEGEIIELKYTTHAGCEIFGNSSSMTCTTSKNNSCVFVASYKYKPVSLTVINSTTDNGFAVNITGQYPSIGTCPTLNSNAQCNLMVFHSTPYTVSITGPNARFTYNNQPITLPYTLTPTEDGILAILEPNTNACVYDPAWCGGIALPDVLRDNLVAATGNGPKCFYATEIARLANEWSGNGIRINGAKRGSHAQGRCGNPTPAEDTWGGQPECSAILANVERADGGYYIYVESGGYGYFDTQGGTPDCAGGEIIVSSSLPPPSPSSGAFKPCTEAGFKAGDIPGYNGTCASIGIQDDYNSDLYDCICRGSKDIYQNQSGGKLACYEYYEAPSGMVKCAGDKIAKQ
jgi:hypothetical protein